MKKKENVQHVYLISIVSKMLNVHPQTLRLYEKEGLIHPLRTKKQRLYSDNDVEKLNFILELTRELGVNKAGVDIIIRMRRKMEIMQSEIEEMMGFLEEEIQKNFREKLRKALSDASDAPR
ncbi:MAG: MerR family transcriptional regulator [Nitrospirae bacterium GWC2_42_7]|nr:MAG: MerR family transcriptional regulator [Nitrospirae bacterium GWC2_42_7]